MRGDLREIDFDHVDQVLTLLNAPDGHARIQIPGVDVLRSLDWVRFARPLPGPVERDYSIRVRPPGAVSTSWRNTDFYFEVIDESGNAAGNAPSRGKLVARLNWGCIGSAEIELRNWRPGDAYRRAGDGREHKIKTMFQEARVPLWERRNWPILLVARRIAWSPGFGPAADFAVDSTAGATMLVVMERKRNGE